MSRETPRRWSTDSASSSLKKQKTDEKGKDCVSASSDPLSDMLNEVQGDLKGVAKNMGKMAAAMERKTAIQEQFYLVVRLGLIGPFTSIRDTE